MQEKVPQKDNFVDRYFKERLSQAGIEGKEIARYTFGFDIIFCKDTNGTLQPLIAEINGNRSGNETPSATTGPEDRQKNLFMDLRNEPSKLIENLFPMFMVIEYALFLGGKNAKIARKYLEEFGQTLHDSQEQEVMVKWLRSMSTKQNKEAFSLKGDRYKAYKEFMSVVTFHDFELWKEKWRPKLELDYNVLAASYLSHRNLPIFQREYQNFPDLQLRLTDKKTMNELIPSHFRPQEWDGRNYNSPTGFWIVKPRGGFQQRKIEILSNIQLANRVQTDPNLLSSYVVQVLMPTEKPDNAPAESTGHNAFMRLRLDVISRANEKGQRNMQIAYGDSVMCVFGKHAASKRTPAFANIDFQGPATFYKPSAAELERAMAVAKQTISSLSETFEPLIAERKTNANPTGI
jgi:hypothetical protein